MVQVLLFQSHFTEHAYLIKAKLLKQFHLFGKATAKFFKNLAVNWHHLSYLVLPIVRHLGLEVLLSKRVVVNLALIYNGNRISTDSLKIELEFSIKERLVNVEEGAGTIDHDRILKASFFCRRNKTIGDKVDLVTDRACWLNNCSVLERHILHWDYNSVYK